MAAYQEVAVGYNYQDMSTELLPRHHNLQLLIRTTLTNTWGPQFCLQAMLLPIISVFIFPFSLLSPHHNLATATDVPSRAHTPITQKLYDDLAVYAHLIDIAYCISPATRIGEPFECENGCDEFNDTEVVFQWTTNDLDVWKGARKWLRPTWMLSDRFATTGYIALWHTRDTLVVVLRGTRSFKDTIVDLNADMVDFSLDCPGCKVHSGFHNSYKTTWDHIHEKLRDTMDEYPEYRVLVMGHSMGGAISQLLTLELLKYRHHEGELQCITMGQPMVGNRVFAHYVDTLLHLRSEDSLTKGALLRVTHKNDPVVKLPISDSYIIVDRYAHSSNEIFIDELGHQLPLLENVIYCEGSEDQLCSHGMKFTRDNTEHLNYFRRMGMCGLGPHFDDI